MRNSLFAAGSCMHNRKMTTFALVSHFFISLRLIVGAKKRIISDLLKLVLLKKTEKMSSMEICCGLYS
jgi:hypothetical protein